MSVRTFAWKLASPYDAYVSHVARLEQALRRIQDLSVLALGYEAGLHGSLRLVPPDKADPRADRLRARLGSVTGDMSDDEFEEFVAQLGGGERATVEGDRARAASRLSHTTESIARYFAVASEELSTLESRGYTPSRPDVARLLRDNRLPAMTIAQYRMRLRELGAQVGRSV
jgi:hypothetical protein